MKTLNELTLLDKFLFDEVMDIPEAHEAALRIILGDENHCLESYKSEVVGRQLPPEMRE